MDGLLLVAFVHKKGGKAQWMSPRSVSNSLICSCGLFLKFLAMANGTHHRVFYPTVVVVVVVGVGS